MRNSGKRAEGYIDCNMEHGLDNDCGTCTFNSEFGTSKTNKIEVMVYMAARTAVFFQSILLGGASIPGQSTFIECENTRINYFDNTDCNSSGTVNNCKHCDSCNTNKIPTCLP